MKTALALAVLVLAVRAQVWPVAAIAAVVLAFRVGFSSAVRKSAVPLVPLFCRRFFLGRL